MVTIKANRIGKLENSILLRIIEAINRRLPLFLFNTQTCLVIALALAGVQSLYIRVDVNLYITYTFQTTERIGAFTLVLSTKSH